MARCETCGNEYARCMEITLDGRSHVFDCFECAIQTLAPACTHCGCTVIGHGVDRHGQLFCCEHCARPGSDSSRTTPATEPADIRAPPA